MLMNSPTALSKTYSVELYPEEFDYWFRDAVKEEPLLRDYKHIVYLTLKICYEQHDGEMKQL